MRQTLDHSHTGPDNKTAYLDGRSRKIVKVMPFGAFVNLLPGIDAMLHVSEMAEGRTEKVEDVVNVGDVVDVQILSFERSKIQVTLQILTSQESIDEREKTRSKRGPRKDLPQRNTKNGHAVNLPTPELAVPPSQIKAKNE